MRRERIVPTTNRTYTLFYQQTEHIPCSINKQNIYVVLSTSRTYTLFYQQTEHIPCSINKQNIYVVLSTNRTYTLFYQQTEHIRCYSNKQNIYVVLSTNRTYTLFYQQTIEHKNKLLPLTVNHWTQKRTTTSNHKPLNTKMTNLILQIF
jgi:predicted lactoylglutathione lyase